MLPSSTSSLFGDLNVEITPDAPLGAMTWYGVGGRADLLVRPADIDSLALLVKRCHRSGTPLRILGSGANLLVADEGVDGIVVRLDATFFRETKFRQSADAQLLRAMAGADMARTLMDATRRGLEGLSQMAGIPASVGGAVRMNAGGAYGCIGDSVHSVTCITRNGEKVTYPAEELRFTYRATNIPDPVIAAATFNLIPTDPIGLRQKVKEIFAEKKASQPLGEHSAGCVFKNPIDPAKVRRVSAGKLIDRAGLKGETIGGATVSRRHANFIVAEPGATAGDVINLMKLIKQRVFDHAGIELKEEIVIWRRGEEP
ncbi:MAG: UDP-N-acetylmuramate dehydrogenase [Phycisphaerales bacterium]|nr:MAG: UDP-N-acetylmuramate dehydrogenase [Phycisphaerales bacterium]